MNDDIRFERLFADGLHESAPRRAPDRLRTTIKAQTADVRPRARWWALIKEPTMRSNNRVAVGSPAARVAAIMVATLLAAMTLIGAGIAGAQLLAADGPIIVDADGGGDLSTIQAADDGDEIHVKPGTYPEAVTIEKDIILRGDGPVEEVIVELADATLFTLGQTDATVAGLTLRGDEDTQGMLVGGGAPTIRGLVFDGTGVPYASDRPGDGGSLLVFDGAVRVVDSRFLDGGEIRISFDANAVLENNEFIGGPHLYLENPGDEAVVRGNRFSGTFDRAIGLFGESTMLIEGNTVAGAAGDGITVGWNDAPGHDPLIRDNDISGTAIGINAIRSTAPVVEGNRLHDNETAIFSDTDGATYANNELFGNGVGIRLQGAPVLDANSVVDGGVGISVLGPETAPILTDNTVCGNEQNVQVSESVTTPPLEYDESNEICADEPAE